MSTINQATQSPNNKNEPKTKSAGEVRYDADIAARVCERIATTPQSLADICESSDMPGIATVFRWLHKHPEFREMYVIAKQEQVELLMDECIQIVDDASKDLIVTDDGRTILNPVAVQRAKLQVNFRQWMASKLHPRKYGNNAQLEAAAPPPAPPVSPDGDPVVTKEVLLYLQASRRKYVDRMLREKEANSNANPPSAKEQEEDRYFTPPPAPPRG